jgi:hypothetical protein
MGDTIANVARKVVGAQREQMFRLDVLELHRPLS